MNGFPAEEVVAEKICRIPTNVERLHRKKKPDESWPGYVYGNEIFNKIGAQFRSVGGKSEMLLHDIVYEVEELCPTGIERKRSIGIKAVNELKSDPFLGSFEYHEEDIWNQGEVHILTMIGMCLASCQLIEFYISNSFILGLSKVQKEKYETINDLRDGWRKKTLGNMLKSIEEAWEIEPVLRENLRVFLANRNRLIHGITTEERFDIRTLWGQAELVSFLSFFGLHARIIKLAFRSSYYISIQLGIDVSGNPDLASKKIFGRKHKKEMDLFVHFFEPKYDAM
jgi:hypothetical protein